MLKYVILAAVLLLVVVLIVLAIRGIAQAIHDNVVIHRYNSQMNGLRKERVLQEQEKQRRIRGETEDTPQYAAGDEKDRIDRSQFRYLNQGSQSKDDNFIIGFIVVAVAIAIAYFRTH